MNAYLGDRAQDLRPGDRLRDPQSGRYYLVWGVRIYDDYDNGMLDTYYDLITEDGRRITLQALAVSRWEQV